MNLKKSVGTTLLAGMFLLSSPLAVVATPHFTLNPSSGTQTVGQNFTVTMGIDSDTEKVVGVDLKASFDSSKLEVVSIDKATNIPDTGYLFSYTSGQAIIHNDTGVFEVTLTPLNQSVLVGPIAKHDLLVVTFKPKAAGTATFNYTCTAGSVVETNIISSAGTDVVDCTTNQSGSYTINAGSGGDSGSVAATATPTLTPTTDTTSLPKTGGIANTVALIVLGISSIGAALYFRWI